MTAPFSQKTIWETPSELPDVLMDEMVKYCDNLHYEKAEIGKSRTVDLTQRNAGISWIPWDSWIPGVIHNIMISANLSYFNYDLEYFESRIQSTLYTGEDSSHYTWHVDDSQSFSLNNKQHERKLSCSLILSDPDEYEGGELQFSYYKSFFKTLKPPKGTAVIFPSWLPHRVRPVKSGTRKSLVAWMHGPAFK
tara:strand:- start:1428 stop:2006 length:579 start_codon:yes stop_codon:yes gene_type:complete